MKINRREFLGAGPAALAVEMPGHAAAKVSPPPRRRNVLPIVADDRGDDLGCAGGEVRTPALDTLAREGVLFTDACASVSPCSSSRATLYTGLYSHTYGMYGLAHHEIDQYPTRRYGYFRDLRREPEVPIASDAALSPSWKAVTTTPGTKPGKRKLDAFHHRPAEELYDLTADPDEVINLAGDAKYAAVLADLRRQLDSWRTKTHAPWRKGVTDPFGRAHQEIQIGENE